MFRLGRMEQFKDELELIRNEDVRAFTFCGLRQAPEYWWTVESSKTYHYKDERKKSGRVKHAKRCAKLAYSIAGALQIDDIGTDLLVSASLLHDICVRGMDDEPCSDKAIFEHPLCVRVKLGGLIGQYRNHLWVIPLLGLIETHMGRWCSIPPRTELEKLFHLVDVIASRDFVKIEV